MRATARSMGLPPTRRPRPLRHSAWRSTIGAGLGSRSSSGPANDCPSPRPSCDWCSSAHPGCTSCRVAGARLSPASSCSGSIPSPGIRLILDAHRADAAGPQEIELDMDFAHEGGEGPPPTRSCCTLPWSGTAPTSPVRTASRRRGGLCSRCWTHRRPSSPIGRARGVPEAPMSWQPGSAAGMSPGCPARAEGTVGSSARRVAGRAGGRPGHGRAQLRL